MRIDEVHNVLLEGFAIESLRRQPRSPGDADAVALLRIRQCFSLSRSCPVYLYEEPLVGPVWHSVQDEWRATGNPSRETV